MGGMIETIRNAFKIPDLRKKILFTILMLIVCRFGAAIPVPGVNKEALAELIASDNGGIFSMLNTITGNALSNATIFAMGIVPYVNASIIIQLLTVAIPRLERLQKEGEEGRKIIGQYMRYGTVVLGLIQAIALTLSLGDMLVKKDAISYITVIISFTAGTAFLMWVGEQITEYGVGNGISMIIFAGIVSRAPAGVIALYSITAGSGKGLLWNAFIIIGILVVFLAVIVGVVWVQDSERRIPVQYAKRVVGRKVYGGQSTHIPMKVNMSGVMPIIFASSMMAFPATIIRFFTPQGKEGPIAKFFLSAPGTPWYAVLSGLLIVAFTFFYTFVYFNPMEVANNLKKNGGFIPGIRPGKPTVEYISKVLNRITLFGGIFLAAINLLPTIMGYTTGVSGVWFAGTSVLILVGVALETVKQLESQMLMRHYKGFLE